MQERSKPALIVVAVAGILAMGLAGWWIGGMGVSKPQFAPAPDAAVTSAPTAPVASAPLKTYPTNVEGFIQNWLILDPIHLEGVGDHSETVEKPMFAKEYFKNQLTVIPEDETKITVAGKDLVWHKVNIDSAQIDLAQFCADHTTDPNSCLFFGFTCIVAEDDLKNVKLAIGSDDSSVWWLNGEEVIRSYSNRAVNPDDNKSKQITLNKGLNMLRFAVIQGDGPTGACARFYDTAGKPLTSIKVTTDTP